jgi:hypothetical protein
MDHAGIFWNNKHKNLIIREKRENIDSFFVFFRPPLLNRSYIFSPFLIEMFSDIFRGILSSLESIETKWNSQNV